MTLGLVSKLVYNNTTSYRKLYKAVEEKYPPVIRRNFQPKCNITNSKWGTQPILGPPPTLEDLNVLFFLIQPQLPMCKMVFQG